MGSSACRPSSVTTSAQSDSNNEGAKVEHANMAQLPGRNHQSFGKQVLEASFQPPMRVMRLVKATKIRWWSVYKVLHRAYKLRKALVAFWLLTEG